jgi:hypothetical protein
MRLSRVRMAGHFRCVKGEAHRRVALRETEERVGEIAGVQGTSSGFDYVTHIHENL